MSIPPVIFYPPSREVECKECDGSGHVDVNYDDDDEWEKDYVGCDYCGGSGWNTILARTPFLYLNSSVQIGSCSADERIGNRRFWWEESQSQFHGPEFEFLYQRITTKDGSHYYELIDPPKEKMEQKEQKKEEALVEIPMVTKTKTFKIQNPNHQEARLVYGSCRKCAVSIQMSFGCCTVCGNSLSVI